MTTQTDFTDVDEKEEDFEAVYDDVEELEDQTPEAFEVEYEEHISDHTGITSDDSVSLYLNEMSRVPLLSKDEEIALAKKMEIGRQARQMMIDSDGELENIEEIKSLIKEGKEAREYLIKANIRLVVSIAKKYRRFGSSFLDLIQAGNVGLIRAVDKFDYSLGNRFSTYATWWIRRSVLRFLNQQERTIRLPNYLSNRLRKVQHVTRDLSQELGRQPTLEEISELVEQTPEELRQLIHYSRLPISLDEPVGEDGENELLNFVENENAVVPFNSVQQTLLEEDISGALGDLSEREASIIKLRFGLEGNRSHTLKELGEIFGVTRERIRQIQQKALRKLRSPQNQVKLRNYL
ncbi:MAG: sigma-70 family RNA polymerase sigma factor [Anaerolineaceae bacterium]|nr:sigma-70 family RNA polymerase sigma factor [Anaerolineaceae bacterium]